MKKTIFNKLWLEDAHFASWLEKDKTSVSTFKCKRCQLTLELGNMGRRALTKGSFISLALKCNFLTNSLLIKKHFGVQDMNIRPESSCTDTNLEFSSVT